jgi:hypothetical protein
MARIGSFAGPSFAYGDPLSIIQPPDNKFPQFDPELAMTGDLTDLQRHELQSKVDELTATLILSRDYRGA